jgi:hypothetical protein
MVSAAERHVAAKRLVAFFAVIGEAPPHSLIELAGAEVHAPATGSWGVLEP